MVPVLKQLVNEVSDFYANIRSAPITPSVQAAEIQTHLAAHYGDFATSTPLEEILKDVTSMMRNWGLQTTHPRYFGLFNPSVHIASVVADTLVALYNPQLAAWSHAPAANEIERYTLDFFLSQLGFNPDTSIASFTTGGSEANLSAVLVALTDAFPKYGDEGVSALSSKPLIYVSGESHHSFEKIAHITGIGRRALRVVSVDSYLKLNVDDLRRQIGKDKARGYAPLMVVGTAGTTSAGVIDPLPEIAELCREYGMWFHVDAAWGGTAILSPKLKPYLRGIESADSVTWDAHKWLSVPMGAGMFFCKRKEAVARTFGVETSYMPDKTEATTDPYVTTIQWSRRFIGLKVFMALAELGLPGYQDVIDHQVLMGHELRIGLERKGWKIVNDTLLPVVCFTHEKIENGSIAPAEIFRELYRRGDFWISEVCLGGAIQALRACITSFRTEKEDVDQLIDTIEEIISA
jgi:aromatic-L-amino-acid decarboxylase